MKKNYENAEVEVIAFAASDVIETSGGITNDGDNDSPWGA